MIADEIETRRPASLLRRHTGDDVGSTLHRVLGYDESDFIQPLNIHASNDVPCGLSDSCFL